MLLRPRGELRRQSLADDEVTVGDRGLEDRGRALDRQADPVADVQPGVLRACCTARTMSRAMPSASSSGVTSVSSTTKPPPGSIAVARLSAAASGHDRLQGVLPLDELEPAGGHDAVGGDRPVTGLGALDGLLDVLAQARAGGPGVDDEPLLDAEFGLARGRRCRRG